MKKIISVLMTVLVVVSCLGGCGSNGQSVNNEKLTIVTTIFPEYDWVMNILGDKASDAEVVMLLDNGVDLHSYQPTAEDILKISSCDVFVYVGGESDGWVDDALQEAVNKNMIVINLLEELGDSVKEEEVVEGMQEEDEHDHHHGDDDEDDDHEHHHDDEDEDDDHEHHHDDEDEDDDHEHHHDEDEDEDHDHHHDEDEVEYDEHVWLSLKNTAVLVDSITAALSQADPDNASVYRSNADAYKDKLAELDGRYEEAVAAGNKDTVLFGDRFPFRYLTDDYGLNYYAAFVGCFAESEASFETITFLSEKVDELGLGAVLTIEGNDHRIAETVIQNTAEGNQKVLTMDSMQSVTKDDVAKGVTYLSIMEENLNVLKEALN